MTELWLIRHGQSQGNATGSFQGHRDSPLTDLGKRQAAALAQRIRGEGYFDVIYSSDLRRARETAQPLGRILKLPVNENVGLREVDVGLWGGLTSQEIERRFPDEWQAWKRHDPHVKRGGAESYSDLQRRIVSTIDSLAALHPGQRVLLVFHGAALKSYVSHLLGMAPGDMWRTDIHNASITRVRLDTSWLDSPGVRPGRIIWLNDTCHLKGMR